MYFIKYYIGISIRTTLKTNETRRKIYIKFVPTIKVIIIIENLTIVLFASQKFNDYDTINFRYRRFDFDTYVSR